MDFDLNTLFNEHDTDHDGKLTSQQAYNLLKALNVNVYKGSVHKIVRLMNYANPDQNSLTLLQFTEYYQAQKYKPKYDSWKAKYNIHSNIHQLRANVHAAPNIQDDEPVTGDVKITIGPNVPKYPNNVNIHIEKKQKEQSKPFIKVVIECKDNNEATKVQLLIKQVHTLLIDILKAQEAQYQKQFDSVHLITNANGNKVSVFITTSNQSWMDLGILASEFLDRMLGVNIELTADIKVGFSFDFEKFINDQEYNFYEMFTQNCKWELKWKGSQVMDAVRQLLLANKFFENLTYNPKSQDVLPFILLTNTKRLNLDLQFDNLGQNHGQLQTKGQMINMLKEMKQGLKQMQGIGPKVLELIQLLNGRIMVEASLGNWKVDLVLDTKNVNKLLLNLPQDAPQDGGYNSD